MSKVAVVMGSDSDLPVMADAVRVLEDLGVEAEMIISSAHRTPDRTMEYARAAVDRGIEVIIAGAGGAAHLAGVIAAFTPLPVIGVPIKSSSLDGLDSLLSMVQMPRGIPVATVAIGGARNAGLLAARILAIKYPAVRQAVERFAVELEAGVAAKAERLSRIGYQAYLESP